MNLAFKLAAYLDGTWNLDSTIDEISFNIQKLLAEKLDLSNARVVVLYLTATPSRRLEGLSSVLLGSLVSLPLPVYYDFFGLIRSPRSLRSVAMATEVSVSVSILGFSTVLAH